MYKTYPLNIIGGNYKSRSTSWNHQSLVNLYVDRQQTGKTESALMAWPGEKVYTESASAGTCRAFHVCDERLFAVFDRVLYEIIPGSPNVADPKVEIPGESRLAVANDGRNIIFRLAGSVAFINFKFIIQGAGTTYMYNLENETLETIQLPPLLDDEYVTNDVNDVRNFRNQRVASAQLDGDPIRQIFVFQQKVVMGGTQSLEFFFDDANETIGTPIKPLRQASTTRVGVGSRFSMAETANFFYFLGNDNIVYQIASYQAQSIVDSSVARQLREIDKTDALGFTCLLDGQWFYILQFPNANATLVYSEAMNTWIRLSTGVEMSIPRHRLAGVAQVYGRTLIADEINGKVYEWDFDTYTSDSEPIAREFITAPLSGFSIGMPNRRLFTNKIVLSMQTGVGNTDEVNPKVIMSSSVDGGKSFEAGDFVKIGRASASGKIVEWYTRQTFYELSLKVRCTDPNFVSFHGASIDIKDGGI